MYTALVIFVENLKDTTATATGVDDELVQSTAGTLSADSPSFVPSSASEDRNEYLDANKNEYEPQSACMDVEIDLEMEECLNEILKERQGVMNYSEAAKVNLSIISKKVQRASLRTHHYQSRKDHQEDDFTMCLDDFSSEEGGVGLSDEEIDDLKSFGRLKVQHFYRTKPERDEARRRHLEEVAKRSTRHPNERNVAAQAHHLLAHQLKTTARGGRHNFRTSALQQ